MVSQSDFSRATAFVGGDLLRYLVRREDSVFEGKRFAGRYLLERVLSVTAASVLLLARRRDFGGQCVIKILVEDRPDSKLIRRFYREVRSLREIRHASVVRLEDAGVEDGVPYYVMEYVKGPTLAEYVRRKVGAGEALPRADWLRGVFRALAEALEHCHEFGVLHRDVKPENIVIDEVHDLPVLVDFGLVKRNPELGSDLAYMKERLTTQGEMLGTPAYQSPEQVDPGGDFGEVGPAADVWGLGATLFYCLTGETPYSEGTVLETYVALLTKDPREVGDLNEDVARDLGDLTGWCLSKESRRRPGFGEIIQFLSVSGGFVGRRGGYVLAALGAFILLIVGILGVFGTGKERLAHMDLVVKDLTSEDTVLISGTVNRDEFRVSVGGLSFEGEDGHWEGRVPLKEGMNVLGLVLEDEEGRVSRRKLIVERDTRRPRLVFEGASENFVRKSRGWIEGQVRDDHPARLLIDGEDVVLGRDGCFEFHVGEGVGSRVLSVEAFDRCGNRAEREVWVVGGEEQASKSFGEGSSSEFGGHRKY